MTMQTAVPDVLTRLATVAEASQVAGRNGEAQWSLKLLIKDISQFPIPCFMALDRASRVLKEDTLFVTMRRGKLKQGKEGKYPSEFFWDLTGWNVKPPTTQAPSATEKPQETAPRAPVPWDAADTQSRISWAQAVNLGVETTLHLGVAEESYMEHVEAWANRFYPLIRKGPTPQEPPLFEDGDDHPEEPPYEEHIEPDGHGGADVVREPAPSRKSFPIWDKAKQTDWQYITSVAKDLYQTDQQDFRQLLGMSWVEWVRKHKTSEAAIQAAVLRMAE